MKLFKKYSAAALFTAFLFVSAVSMNSCDSGSGPSGQQDTIHLATLPGNVQLTDFTTFDTVDLKLTCGCPFRLNVLSAGGDTSAFIVGYVAADTSKVTPHPIGIRVNPQVAPHHTYSGWLLFSAVDHLGGTDYDTLRFSATIP